MRTRIVLTQAVALSACLLLGACGGKFDRLAGGVTKVSFGRGGGGQLKQRTYQAQDGGVFVWGVSASGSFMSFFVANDSVSTKTESLPNDDWAFYSMGWTGNTAAAVPTSTGPLSGDDIRCGISNVQLVGTDTTVNITLNEDCQTGLGGFFSAATNMSPTPFAPLPVTFVSCAGNVAALNGSVSATACNGSTGDLLSYQIALGAADPAIGNTPFPSICFDAGGAGVEASPARVPVGPAGGNPALYTIVTGYAGANCSGPSQSYTFPRGLLGGEESGLAALGQASGPPGNTLVFLQNRPVELLNLFPTAIPLGSTAPANTVSLDGLNFTTATTITVDSSPCSPITFNSSTNISCNVTGISEGQHTITVANPDGTSSQLVNALSVTSDPIPSISAILPGTVPRTASLITLTGVNFAAGAVVLVNNGNSWLNCPVTAFSSTSISCNFPAGLPVGIASVELANPDGLVAFFNSLNVSSDTPPTASSLFPTAGQPGAGTLITIGGTGFTSGVAVTVNGIACNSVNLLSSSSLNCHVPSSLTTVGSYAVVVTNADGEMAFLAMQFTISTNAAPVVSGVAPATVAQSQPTNITISGTGFVPGSGGSGTGADASQVTIGTNILCVLQSVSSTAIVCAVPSGMTTGPVGYTVQNPDGQIDQVSAGGPFNISVSASTPPSASAIFPTAGLVGGGTTVIIKGAQFSSTGIGVTIGGTACTSPFTVAGSGNTQVQCTTVAQAAGTYQVVVTNNDGQEAFLNNAFTFTTDSPPTLGNPVAAPFSIPIGSAHAVILNGSNLQTGLSVNFISNATGTFFGCSGPTVSNSNSIVTCTAPSMPTGMYNVALANPDGLAAQQASALFVDDSFGTGQDGTPSNITTSITDPTTQDVNGRPLAANQWVSGMAAPTSAGFQALTVPNTINTGDFLAGDEVLWHVSAASSSSACDSGNSLPAGTYGFAHIADISGQIIYIDNPITPNPSAAITATNRNSGQTFCLIQIVRVPNFGQLNFAPGTAISWSPRAFNMTTGFGGILAMRISSQLSLTGSAAVQILGDALGYAGGLGSPSTPTQGDGRLGIGQASTAADDLGGGASGSSSGAGGGGNSQIGGRGGDTGVGGGTDTTCQPTTGCITFGGGGGGSGTSSANGGAGGGIVIAYAKNVVFNSFSNLFTVRSQGGAGAPSSTQGGGAGAGGSVLLQVESGTGATITANATGGSGGNSTSVGSGNGGGGGGSGVLEASYCTSSSATFSPSLPNPQSGGTGGGVSGSGSSGQSGLSANTFNTSHSSGQAFCP